MNCTKVKSLNQWNNNKQKVDYYSKWLEITPVKSTNSLTLIDCCKNIFLDLVFIQIIAANMPFDRYEFKLFSFRYKFKITTLNSYYPHSNGLVEKSIGITKKIVKKSAEQKKDLQLFLLYYRNTLLSGCEYSPSQL